MYSQFLTDFHVQHPEIPQECGIDLGSGIKQIRLRKGLTQEELARRANINLSTMTTIENEDTKFATYENLVAIAKGLDVTLTEIIMEAYERFPANFFPVKSIPPPKRKNKEKEGKRRLDIWLQRKSLRYKGFRVYMNSPAIKEYRHFCSCIIEVDEGEKVENLHLPHIGQVSCFVDSGNCKIVYDQDQVFNGIAAGQGFTLRGDKLHTFVNINQFDKLRLFLVYAIPPNYWGKKKEHFSDLSNNAARSIRNTIKNLRYFFSPFEKRPIPRNYFCQYTGLTKRKMEYLEKNAELNYVIPWKTIDQIMHRLNMSLKQFLWLSQGEDKGYVRIAQAHDRALIDYKSQIGVKIKSALLFSTEHEFHLSEVYINPRKGIFRNSWEKTDNAIISVCVEDGSLNVQVGKNRKIQLKKNESLYFDAGLGYSLSNPGTTPCRLIVASHPAIIF